MTLPEISTNPPSPREWAERVQLYEPHGLDVLEAHVLAYATGADELSKIPAWSMVWTITAGYLSFFASIGGFAALFGNPRTIQRGWTEEPGISVLPWASLSYAIGILGVVLMGIWWLRESRRRLPGPQFLLGFTVVFGALGVPVANGIVAEAGGELGMTMVPAYLMMALAVILFVIIRLSPQPDPEPEKPPLPIEELDEKAMKQLMRERSDAIDIYVRRRLTPDLDAKMLKARPLGRLHLEGSDEDSTLDDSDTDEVS